jgi:hypothetical protein
MMSAVQELDLTVVGALIEVPNAGPDRSTVGGRRASGRRRGDRLSELAAWWTSVAGTAPPRRVEQLWLSRPSSAGSARAEVILRRFDAPPDVTDALAWGIASADDAVDDGTDLILLSVPPAAPDDVAGYVLAGQLLGLDAVEAMGWPHQAGVGDEDWVDIVGRIRDGLRRVRGLRDQPQELLEALGSPSLAAGTALLLRSAARRTPALLDGPGAAACALLASRIADAGRSWWHAADVGGPALSERVLEELRITPLTDLGLWDEDGTAARIGLTLLETAIERAIDRADDEDDLPLLELTDDEPML